MEVNFNGSSLTNWGRKAPFFLEVKMKTFHHFIKMLNQTPGRVYGGNFRDGAAVKKEILSSLQECKIIIDGTAIAKDHYDTFGIKHDDLISPPFKTCWIQPPDELVTEVKITSESDQTEFVHGIYLHETAPYVYAFAIVISDRLDSRMLRVKYGALKTETGASEDAFEWRAIFAFLRPFASSHHLGTVKVNERIKFKSDGAKESFKIKKVVYVFPGGKKSKEQAEKRFVSIDWSHQWAVRGHWRKINGIGKDRAGSYCMANFTWVEEHVKGPEDKPLIQKTRIIKE